MMAEFLKKALFSRMFTAEKGEIKLLKSDYMLVHVPAMAEMIYDLSKSKKEREKLYEVGYDSGKAVMKDFKSVLPASKVVISTMMELQEMMGWGNITIKQFDLEKKYIELHWKSEIAQSLFEKFGKQKEPMCSWPMGVVTGALEELTGLKLKVKEIKCIAKGDDHCELVLRGK
jgi:predicted hydrocarbon binding protein